MIIKSSEGRQADIAELERLLSSPKADAQTRSLIEREIRNIKAGLKGEREAAYEIEFAFGQSERWAIIHDLRIEHAGRVAQIDHLVINRALDAWVCESKHFSEGVSFNEQGECCAWHMGKPYGLPSPIEQNKKHITALKAALDEGAAKLPTRLGLAMKPSLKSLILVSKNARISRPKAPIPGIETVIKTDAFLSKVHKDVDNMSPLSIAKLCGSQTLREVAQAIADLHKPIVFNWAARFGLPGNPAAPVSNANDARPFAPPAGAALPKRSEAESISKKPSEGGGAPVSGDSKSAAGEDRQRKLVCAACAETITYQEGRFCWTNKARFGNYLYCKGCQATASKLVR